MDNPGRIPGGVAGIEVFLFYAAFDMAKEFYPSSYPS